jgi:hypothetical protein
MLSVVLSTPGLSIRLGHSSQTLPNPCSSVGLAALTTRQQSQQPWQRQAKGHLCTSNTKQGLALAAARVQGFL